MRRKKGIVSIVVFWIIAIGLGFFLIHRKKILSGSADIDDLIYS